MGTWQRLSEILRLDFQWVRLFCVGPTFRAEIQRATLDFPGGRLAAGQSQEYMAPLLPECELGLPAAAIRLITALNNEPWMINSASSNQGLWGFVGEIDSACTVPSQRIGRSAVATHGGLRN